LGAAIQVANILKPETNITQAGMFVLGQG